MISIVLAQKISPSSFVMHGEKSKNFNGLNFNRLFGT
jgi:hypothetical protein